MKKCRKCGCRGKDNEMKRLKDGAYLCSVHYTEMMEGLNEWFLQEADVYPRPQARNEVTR